MYDISFNMLCGYLYDFFSVHDDAFFYSEKMCILRMHDTKKW